MMSVMDRSKISKQSSRSGVGMGSRSHDLGAHLVRIESRYSVVTGLKEVNGVCSYSTSWLQGEGNIR